MIAAMLLTTALLLAAPAQAQTTTDCTAVTQISQVECEALLALYNSTNGSAWAPVGWTTTNTPCNWGGIVCTDGKVTQIILITDKLSGVLPPELGNLVHLETFALLLPPPPAVGGEGGESEAPCGASGLQAGLPEAMSGLVNLRVLMIQDKDMPGVFPAWLSSLTQLDTIDLYCNFLTGGLPTSLNSLSQLKYLRLSHNQFSGSIPPELAQLDLNRLVLHGNMLTGEIPAVFAQRSYEYFSLDYNALWTKDPALKAWLRTVSPGWRKTQTVAPKKMEAKLKPDGVKLKWKPIRYTANNGYYEISYSTTPGGPYTAAGQTSAKTDKSFRVTGLTPGVTYYFVVRTVTLPHYNNLNTVTSEYSKEIAVTMPGGTPVSTLPPQPTFTPSKTPIGLVTPPGGPGGE